MSWCFVFHRVWAVPWRAIFSVRCASFPAIAQRRFPATFVTALYPGAGHDVEVVGPFDEAMGHAGALVRHPNGLIEGASDPRSDGAASGF